MDSAHRRVLRRRAPLILLALALLMLLVAAQGAAAGPPDPTMDLADLRTALSSGPLDGYLLTTMKGTAPEPIPVQVQSVVDYSNGSLILFAASGPQIDRIGGIASGMSGSPIYVDDAGVDKLVGALSYGDSFTLNGLGLATPIEYMAAIEDAFPVGALAGLQAPKPPAPGTYALDEPVATSDGVVRSVRIARSATAAAGVTPAAGQSVMAPLGIIEIGGVREGSRAFARIADKFKSTGMLIKAAAGGGLWEGAPTPDLEPGSPCGVLFAQGAVWVGAAGTVTYVDDEAAMLFGHPFQQFGPIDAVLTGGEVQGVWASSLAPYKLIAPRDVKGTCVQDRGWGVLAHLGRQPDLFPATTTVTIPDRGLARHDETAVSEWLVTGNAYPALPADIATQIVLETADQGSYPGSAETTTTVVVSDKTGTYTIAHDNLWSDPYDVSWYLGWDVGDILSLVAADPDGVLHARVLSTDVTTTVSPTQRSARIDSVSLPGGIHEGAMKALVVCYRYGSPDPQTVEATLTIPKGTPLSGRLIVRPAIAGEDEGPPDEESSPGSGPPLTLAQLADELNGMPNNSDLMVSYQPDGDESGPASPASIDATVSTDWALSGYLSASTAPVMLEAQPRQVAYGGAVQLSGQVISGSDVAVDIYRRYAGSDATVKVATATAVAKGGMASFDVVVGGLRANTTLIARTGPFDGWLPGSASVKVKVSAKVWLSWDKKLTVHVRPDAADGTAVLQKKRSGAWTYYKTVKIVDGAGVTSLPRGKHTLRARFSGSSLCAPGVSKPFTVTVK